MREQGGHLEGLARTALLPQGALCLPSPTAVGQLVELETRMGCGSSGGAGSGRERGKIEGNERERNRALASEGQTERHGAIYLKLEVNQHLGIRKETVLLS